MSTMAQDHPDPVDVVSTIPRSVPPESVMSHNDVQRTQAERSSVSRVKNDVSVNGLSIRAQSVHSWRSSVVLSVHFFEIWRRELLESRTIELSANMISASESDQVTSTEFS